MYKLCFLLYLICFTASDAGLLTFEAHDEFLTKCILHQLVSLDSTLKLSKSANDVAHLASKRFHGKSMPIINFNNRYHQFCYEIRTGKFNGVMRKDQFSEPLRAALKQALIACASVSPAKSTRGPEAVLAQSKESITFGQYYHFLSKCIENHLKLTGCPELNLNEEVTKFIAECAARRYYGKSFLRKDFYKRQKNLFYYLQKSNIFNDTKTPERLRELKLTVRQAVEDCAMDKRPLVAVPTFENEPPGIAHILNLMLVKWPNDLYDMLQSNIDRAILRRYANDALTALLSELNLTRYDTQMFRLALRIFWTYRAQKIFDGNSADLPYILHSYTLTYPTPHTVQSDFEEFINRSSISFKERNPKVPVSYLYEILNIRRPDHPTRNGDVDIYDDYINNGMTSSEYYFENQINQFYRVLFFFLELQTRGLGINEDDNIYGALSNDLVPEHVQAIVYDDDVYRDYLLNKRYFYENLIGDGQIYQNNIAQNLFNSPRVLEENLVLLMSNVPTTSGIKSVSESSTTSTTTQSLKRKDDVWKNENGKCFPKRAKTTACPNSGGVNENLSMEELSRVTSSTDQESCNYFESDFSDEDFPMRFLDEFCAVLDQEKNETENFYGYVFSNDDSKYFTHEELLTIQDMFFC